MRSIGSGVRLPLRYLQAWETSVGTTVGQAARAELVVRDFVGRKVWQLDTPALLVDLDTMEQNLRTMAEFFQKQNAKLRPHFKNHRVIEFAHKQIDHGAVGITCARLWHSKAWPRGISSTGV